jgi:hypothetical protein
MKTNTSLMSILPLANRDLVFHGSSRMQVPAGNENGENIQQRNENGDSLQQRRQRLLVLLDEAITLIDVNDFVSTSPHSSSLNPWNDGGAQGFQARQ